MVDLEPWEASSIRYRAHVRRSHPNLDRDTFRIVDSYKRPFVKAVLRHIDSTQSECVSDICRKAKVLKASDDKAERVAGLCLLTALGRSFSGG